MSARRQILLVTLVAIGVAVFLITIPTFRHFFDLGVYRGAVHSWLIDGDELYDYRYQGTQYGFTYPPFAALALSPLAAMPWPVAIAAGLVVNSFAVVVLLRWFVVPILERHGWPRWTPLALAFIAIVVFEPARDTFSYGQVNLILLVLVCADFKSLPHGRWAGVGIGIASAIKLTPAVFIGYLIISRQYRAAATAAGTAAAATLFTLVIAPRESLAFWTGALWDTDRVGRLAYVSNQSLRGVLARLDAPAAYWAIAVLLVLAFWLWVVRSTDRHTGFAATGIVGCLISPVTWVHHLVWVMPALFLLIGRALEIADRPTRLRHLSALSGVYVVMCSSLVWLWYAHPSGWASFAGSNAYVWVTIGLLVAISWPQIRASSPVDLRIGIRQRV
jgi:alpha-1,2-mannosyltransferase